MNMITAAQRILETNPSIEKILILERTPRFDTKNADPLQLKAKLSDNHLQGTELTLWN